MKIKNFYLLIKNKLFIYLFLFSFLLALIFIFLYSYNLNNKDKNFNEINSNNTQVTFLIFANSSNLQLISETLDFTNIKYKTLGDLIINNGVQNKSNLYYFSNKTLFFSYTSFGNMGIFVNNIYNKSTKDWYYKNSHNNTNKNSWEIELPSGNQYLKGVSQIYIVPNCTNVYRFSYISN